METKTIKSIETTWNNDRLMWGPGGWGYDCSDFDAVRRGTQTVTFTDGTEKVYQITSEDDPSERFEVGDTVTIYNENPYGQQPVDASSIPF